MAADAIYSGTAGSPTAGTVVVQSAVLAAGRYQVGIVTYLEGAGTPVLGVDDNNMALFSDSTNLGPVAVVGTKFAPVATAVAEVYVAASKRISVQAVANGTSTVYYSCTLSIHQVAG